MNDFVVHPYDFTDEDIVDYYINFIKSLTMKIDAGQFKLYFNLVIIKISSIFKKYSYFPLIWQANKFYNHKDNLVSTTARNIILTLV
jgi:protein CLEC16A